MPAPYLQFAAAPQNTGTDASQGASVDPSSISKEANQIKSDEGGFREKVYLDTKGKHTIGYGFNMDDPSARTTMLSVGISNFDALRSGTERLTRPEGDRLFSLSLQRAVDDAIKFFGSEIWSKLDEDRQGVLVNMSYQLGYTKLHKFEELKEALMVDDYTKAGFAMLYKHAEEPEKGNSDWYTDAPGRAGELIKRMWYIAPPE